MKQVMRMIKIPRSGVYGVQQERQREKDSKRDFAYSDIDRDRTEFNIHYKQTQNWNKEITRRIKDAGCKEKKDSIVLIGAVFTASKEFFSLNPAYKERPEGEDTRTREEKQKWLFDDRTRKYFEDCIRFYIKHQCGGDKSLVLDCTIDMDEETPHLAIYSTPLVQRGEKYALSAKEIFGNRVKMREYQNNLHKEIGLKYGFERGVQVEWDKPYEERKHHKTTMKWKQEQEAELDNSIMDKEQRESSLTRSLEELEQRIEETKQVLDEYSQERGIAMQNMETLKALNTEIDRLTRMEPRPPAVVENIPAKKNLLGKETQPERVVLDKEDFDTYKEETRFQKSDVWNLGKVETAVNRLWQALEGLDIQRLKAEHSKQAQELNRERQRTSNQQQKIDNMIYDLNCLLQKFPALENEIQKIITQEPDQEQHRSQGRSRG